MLGDTTVNIGGLSGGVADNVVAPWAEARLMIRLVTPVEEVMELIERWANGRATLEWGPMVPPVRLGVVDGFKTSVAAFATDIPALTNWGTPYLFGPGSIHVAHRDDEFVCDRRAMRGGRRVRADRGSAATSVEGTRRAYRLA